MASEWIKEKYETRSDITSLGTQKYGSHRLCDGCLSIIEKTIYWFTNGLHGHIIIVESTGHPHKGCKIFVDLL